MADKRMTWVEHLADLRRRILYTLAVFVVVLGGCLGWVAHIYRYLVSPVTRAGYTLMVVSPGEVVRVYLSVGGVAAVGLTLPFALYQLWRFVAPGLTPVEQRYALRLLPAAAVMFVLGVLFAWFVIFPTLLHFLLHLAAANFQVMLRAGSYFSFLANVCLPFGFIFELPLAVVFLTRMGLLTPRWLRRNRRYAYLVSVVLGVLISPPELISHLSVVLPMICLYELSIGLSLLVQRRQQQAAHTAASRP